MKVEAVSSQGTGLVEGSGDPALADDSGASARAGQHLGHLLYEEILRHHGTIAPGTLMAITAPVSLKSNLMNVILKPATLEAWVANATEEAGEPGKAANQPRVHFDFVKALGR